MRGKWNLHNTFSTPRILFIYSVVHHLHFHKQTPLYTPTRHHCIMNLHYLLNHTPPSPPSPPALKRRSSSSSYEQLDLTTTSTSTPYKRPRLVINHKLSRYPTDPQFSPISDCSDPKSPSHVSGLFCSPIAPTATAITEERSIASTVSTTCPELPGCDQIIVPASRLAQSRIVGHRHRANERERTELLTRETEQLQAEIDQLLCRIPNNIPQPITTPKLHSLSPSSAAVLDSDRISGATALLLLEMVALRRNIYDAASAVSLECPEVHQVNDAVEHCVKVAELEGNSPNWSTHMLQNAAWLHMQWARHESNCAMVEDKPRREKNCSRCGKSRTAGSGHPRSTCDDGFKVSSLIEYRDTTFSNVNNL